MADVALTIIGGGVVGLAIAAELGTSYSPACVLERNPRCGQETSSRNSEVIHAGIYYPPGSLKAQLCVEGNRLLYELGEKHAIPHRRITKLIIATREHDLAELESLERTGRMNGAELKMISAAEVSALEPSLNTAGALFSPSTGIISAHDLMDYFAGTFRQAGGEIHTRCEVVGLERKGGDFSLTTREGNRRESITSEIVINAAGLESDTIASLAGIDVATSHYRLHWCKGSYFSLPASMKNCLARLVYPVPSQDTLGVHAVIDLGGRLKFGPDVEYLQERKAVYAVDPEKRHAFAESVRRILPFVRDEDLTPDMSGIRPKLQSPGEPAQDFVIRHETERGLPGLVNLIGIDSPGLTASPAIARYVHALLRKT